MPFPTEWEIQPHEGAGPVHFGDTYEHVLGLLGGPDQALTQLWRSNAQRAGWKGGAIAVHFNPTVTFIEFSRGTGLVAKLGGIDIFGTPASEVVQRLVSAGRTFDDADPELGHTFVFKEMQVALWRQVVPKSEVDQNGMYFDTVSAGVTGYYR